MGNDLCSMIKINNILYSEISTVKVLLYYEVIANIFERMTDKIKLIFVLGGPGAGKSTVSNIIHSKIPNSTCLKSGQVVRSAVLQHKGISDEEKSNVNVAMQQGALVSDEIITLLLSKEIISVRAVNTFNIFVIDGFPRTVTQLKMLMNDRAFIILGAFFLSAPHVIMEKRCKMRNLRTDRIDDCEGPVETRLHDYLGHVDEIKGELIERKSQFFEIDTCDPMAKMTKTIEEHLKSLK